ncbi:MAG TPA: PPC domain-containing DNA-binding protein [Balneolaceae bacterium]|nr:PPC domain-containing DNA-binding protein [Balneolaceae bacterium]
MKSKFIQKESQKAKTQALIFSTGDAVVSELIDFAGNKGLKSAYFTAIGAFSEATLFYYDWESREYQEIPVNEQVEVLSLMGNITESDGKPKIHIHVTLGRVDGSVIGGHLKEAKVRPTLELFLSEGSEKLQRTHDEKTGLALINL